MCLQFSHDQLKAIIGIVPISLFSWGTSKSHEIIIQKLGYQAGEIAQYVRGLSVKPDNLSSVLGAPMVAGEQLPHVVSHCHACARTHTDEWMHKWDSWGLNVRSHGGIRKKMGLSFFLPMTPAHLPVCLLECSTWRGLCCFLKLLNQWCRNRELLVALGGPSFFSLGYPVCWIAQWLLCRSHVGIPVHLQEACVFSFLSHTLPQCSTPTQGAEETVKL